MSESIRFAATAAKTWTPLTEHYDAIFKKRGFALAPHQRHFVQGIEDDRITFLLAIAAPGVGKSTLLGVAVPTWFLGNDPTLTVLGVSAGEKLIQKQMHASMEILQHSPEFHELYPAVRPDMQAGWSLQSGLYVTGRALGDQDPSYFGAGLASKALTGVHAKRIIWDDLHDETNSRTPDGRAQVVDMTYRTLIGRADPQGARYIAIGRRWATDDLYGRLIASGQWVVMHLPAMRRGESRLWWDVYVPADLECIFSETLPPDPTWGGSNGLRRYRAYYAGDPTGKGFYWPGSRQKRMEFYAVEREQPGIVETTYNGYPERDEGRVFEAADFRPYAPPADLHKGLEAPEVVGWIKGTRGYVLQAWDTALGKQYSESRTVALAGLLVPCSEWHTGEDPEVHGKCPFHYDVYLLDMLSASIDFRKLLQVFRARRLLWAARHEIVEDKASGVDLLQLLKGGGIPIVGKSVTEGKVERAVNGVGGGGASVQGWARMGRVRYPADAKWVKEWLPRVLEFTGDAGQRSDEFDVTVHLVSAAIEASRKGGRIPMPSAASGLAAMDGPPPAAGDPYAAQRGMLEGIAGLDLRQNAVRHGGASTPFDGLCGACAHYTIRENRRWCGLHDRWTAAVHGCPSWERKAAT